MPRNMRLDVRGAIHYAIVRGRPGSSIFFEPAFALQGFPERSSGYATDVRQFESLLGRVCQDYGALVHAWSVEPNSAILVLQAMGSPLNWIMRRLCGQYAQYLHEARIPKTEAVFRARYESKIVAPEYLPHAVRRAHTSPVAAGLSRRRIDYPFSSERAFLGEGRPAFLTTTVVRKALERRGHFGLRGYGAFMDQPETPHVARLFDKGSPQDRRVVGDKLFVRRVRELASGPSDRPSQALLVESAARFIERTPQEIFSSTRSGVLGRALVASLALRTGAAPLSEVGRWFSVSAAALRHAIDHYRVEMPGLFEAPPEIVLDPDAGQCWRRGKPLSIGDETLRCV